MTGYTKLFGSIITSTIWREKNETRILWITMLAMKDKNGMVEGSLPGLADMARLSLQDTIEALDVLRAPDPYSRTKDYDGRRIEDVDGGWTVLNHKKWRDKMNTDERREYLAVKQRESRARRSTDVNNGQQISTPSTHTDADTNSKKEKGLRSKSKPADDAAWRQGLLVDPAYKHINISAEFSKCQRWCDRNKKHFTQARFEAWLNRIEAPITGFNGSRTSKPASIPQSEPAPELTDEQIRKNQEFIRNSVAQLKTQLQIPS